MNMLKLKLDLNFRAHLKHTRIRVIRHPGIVPFSQPLGGDGLTRILGYMLFCIQHFLVRLNLSILPLFSVAREQRYDVVMVDTAGRMQDNEPLMRALAKLITVNTPDLTLFVGK